MSEAVLTKTVQIYAHIWGKATRESHRGIFILNEKEKRWEKIVDMKSSIHKVFVSPNGCKIVYFEYLESSGINFPKMGEVRVVNVCSQEITSN